MTLSLHDHTYYYLALRILCLLLTPFVTKICSYFHILHSFFTFFISFPKHCICRDLQEKYSLIVFRRFQNRYKIDFLKYLQLPFFTSGFWKNLLIQRAQKLETVLLYPNILNSIPFNKLLLIYFVLIFSHYPHLNRPFNSLTIPHGSLFSLHISSLNSLSTSLTHEPPTSNNNRECYKCIQYIVIRSHVPTI